MLSRDQWSSHEGNNLTKCRLEGNGEHVGVTMMRSDHHGLNASHGMGNNLTLHDVGCVGVSGQ